MKTLVVLVGVRGSGKSTQLQKLSRLTGITILKPVTTRPSRGAVDTEYEFCAAAWPTQDQLEWQIEVGEYKYGMRKTELTRLNSTTVGVTVFHPGSLASLPALPDTEIIKVGLDTISDNGEYLRRIGGNDLRNESWGVIEAQLGIVRKCDLVLSGNEEAVHRALLSGISLISKKGVLGDKEIKALLQAKTLLRDYTPENVQSASYDLRLGAEVWCKGQQQTLSDDNAILKIPPYSYVIAKALEQAHLPRFIVGRFDVKVSLFIKGVILSNGPQVDPGYQGALFCLLFNGSDIPVGLSYKEHFATIEFSATNCVTAGYRGRYQLEEKIRAFMDGLASPGGNIIERIDGANSKIKNFMWTAGPILLTCLGIYLALLWNSISQSGKINDLISSAKTSVATIESHTNEIAKIHEDIVQKYRDVITASESVDINAKKVIDIKKEFESRTEVKKITSAPTDKSLCVVTNQPLVLRDQ